MALNSDSNSTGRLTTFALWVLLKAKWWIQRENSDPASCGRQELESSYCKVQHENSN
jgi:hypothetical protein